jgi:hypothetical protein
LQNTCKNAGKGLTAARICESALRKEAEEVEEVEEVEEAEEEPERLERTGNSGLDTGVL